MSPSSIPSAHVMYVIQKRKTLFFFVNAQIFQLESCQQPRLASPQLPPLESPRALTASIFLLDSCRRARLDSKRPIHVRGPKAINNFFFFFLFRLTPNVFNPNRIASATPIGIASSLNIVHFCRSTHVVALASILSVASRVRDPKAGNSFFLSFFKKNPKFLNSSRLPRLESPPP